MSTDGSKGWIQDDKIALESQTLLLSSEPLCLDPNPRVSMMKREITQTRILKKKRLKHHLIQSLRTSEFKLDYPFKLLKHSKNYSPRIECADFNDKIKKLFECNNFQVK